MADGTLRLALAEAADAEALAAISLRSFESDTEVGLKRPGGPPGYDSAVWQASMMQKASAYWKILFDDRLIGGAIVISHPRGRYYLARIFIDPDYHRRGLGTRAMELLFETYPEARLWNLETPPWNVRTRAFYEKLGFTVIRETKDDIFFKRVME